MKKKLLTPPRHNDQILLIPEALNIRQSSQSAQSIGIAHQPYFFNPGVSVKFLALPYFPHPHKKILFVDTDKLNLAVNVPLKGGGRYPLVFIHEQRPLREYPAPAPERWHEFFSRLQGLIQQHLGDKEEVLANTARFKEIIMGKKERMLKEVLAESFLDFYNIGERYQFTSELIQTPLFRDFFEHIYRDHALFRELFNAALDEYKHTYRFRYKNFPFPKLREGELPFWLLREGVRERCFLKSIDMSRYKEYIILPRASTLTLFLRLYHCDYFIHGIGGANYEWVTNRLMERFFKMKPPLYCVVSGTFLLEGINERSLPYFFFEPQRIQERTETFFRSLPVQGSGEKKGKEYSVAD